MSAAIFKILVIYEVTDSRKITTVPQDFPYLDFLHHIKDVHDIPTDTRVRVLVFDSDFNDFKDLDGDIYSEECKKGSIFKLKSISLPGKH
jgi:hypothetical protein